MQMYSRVAAALTMLAASLPALAASATATRAWQFKPESNAGLTVRNLMGTVRVERGTTPGIHVTATTTIEAQSQAEADRLIGLVEFRTSDVGPGSRLDVRLPRAHFPKVYSERGADDWWSVSYVEHLGERIRLVGKPGEAPAVRIDLLIRAPAGAKLEVENAFGDAIAQGYSGTLRLELTNTVPAGEPNYIAGAFPDQVGGYGVYPGRLAVHFPAGTDLQVEDGPAATLAGPDGGSTLLATEIRVPPGETLVWELHYELGQELEGLRLLPSARFPGIEWTVGDRTWSDRRVPSRTVDLP